MVMEVVEVITKQMVVEVMEVITTKAQVMFGMKVDAASPISNRMTVTTVSNKITVTTVSDRMRTRHIWTPRI